MSACVSAPVPSSSSKKWHGVDLATACDDGADTTAQAADPLELLEPDFRIPLPSAEESREQRRAREAWEAAAVRKWRDSAPACAAYRLALAALRGSADGATYSRRVYAEDKKDTIAAIKGLARAAGTHEWGVVTKADRADANRHSRPIETAT